MKWRKGKTLLKKFPKAASEVFTVGDMVTLVNGYITSCSATSVEALGIIQESVAATDADYALTTKVMVKVPNEPNCLFESAVVTALAVTDVGNVMDFSTDAIINEALATYGPVTCEKYISTTLGWFKLNGFEGYRMAKS